MGRRDPFSAMNCVLLGLIFTALVFSRATPTVEDNESIKKDSTYWDEHYANNKNFPNECIGLFRQCDKGGSDGKGGNDGKCSEQEYLDLIKNSAGDKFDQSYASKEFKKMAGSTDSVGIRTFCTFISNEMKTLKP
jgi:hypothetical protein